MQQASLEKVSHVERRLTIVVPASTVEQAYTKEINEMAKKANIKGFRPGKAPISYIQKQFGGAARQEAIDKVVQDAFYQAITEHKLRPVSAPKIEPKASTSDQTFEFTASFEVLPEIEKVNFSMDHVEKLDVEVKSEDAQRVMTQLLKQYTKWKLVERAAHEKDRVVIDYYAIYEGKSDEENKITNFPLELGAATMLPGFEAGLIGAKAGDEKKLSLSFPADFHMADRAGKPIDFVVHVKQVFEAELPAMDENFVKNLGVKSGQVADLEAQIKQSLEQERDRLVREKLKEQVFNRLIELNTIEIPQSLVAREAKAIHDEMYPSHQHHDHHSHSNEEMAAFNDVAKKRVSLGLLIAEYAKQTDLKADKDRVLKRIKEIAAAYENPQEVMDWLSAGDRMAGIEAQVLEDQVVEKLLEGISVTNKTLSYAELKGIGV